MIWSFWSTTGFWSIRRSDNKTRRAFRAGGTPVLLFQLWRRGRKQFVAQAVCVGAAGINCEVKIFGDRVEWRQRREIEPILQALAVFAAESGSERHHSQHFFQR